MRLSHLSDAYGLDSHRFVELAGADHEAKLAETRAAFPRHWRVEDGELFNDGTGPYAVTSHRAPPRANDVAQTLMPASSAR